MLGLPSNKQPANKQCCYGIGVMNDENATPIPPAARFSVKGRMCIVCKSTNDYFGKTSDNVYSGYKIVAGIKEAFDEFYKSKGVK